MHSVHTLATAAVLVAALLQVGCGSKETTPAAPLPAADVDLATLMSRVPAVTPIVAGAPSVDALLDAWDKLHEGSVYAGLGPDTRQKYEEELTEALGAPFEERREAAAKKLAESGIDGTRPVVFGVAPGDESRAVAWLPITSAEAFAAAPWMKSNTPRTLNIGGQQATAGALPDREMLWSVHGEYALLSTSEELEQAALTAAPRPIEMAEREAELAQGAHIVVATRVDDFVPADGAAEGEASSQTAPYLQAAFDRAMAFLTIDASAQQLDARVLVHKRAGAEGAAAALPATLTLPPLVEIDPAAILIALRFPSDFQQFLQRVAADAGDAGKPIRQAQGTMSNLIGEELALAAGITAEGGLVINAAALVKDAKMVNYMLGIFAGSGTKETYRELEVASFPLPIPVPGIAEIHYAVRDQLLLVSTGKASIHAAIDKHLDGVTAGTGLPGEAEDINRAILVFNPGEIAKLPSTGVGMLMGGLEPDQVNLLSSMNNTAPIVLTANEDAEFVDVHTRGEALFSVLLTVPTGVIAISE